jgi:hypothetical protein
MAFHPLTGRQLPQKDKAKAPHPALVAGALAKHLAKMVGAESPSVRMDPLGSFRAASPERERSNLCRHPEARAHPPGRVRTPANPKIPGVVEAE